MTLNALIHVLSNSERGTCQKLIYSVYFTPLTAHMAFNVIEYYTIYIDHNKKLFFHPYPLKRQVFYSHVTHGINRISHTSTSNGVINSKATHACFVNIDGSTKDFQKATHKHACILYCLYYTVTKFLNLLQ